MCKLNFICKKFGDISTVFRLVKSRSYREEYATHFDQTKSRNKYIASHIREIKNTANDNFLFINMFVLIPISVIALNQS